MSFLNFSFNNLKPLSIVLFSIVYMQCQSLSPIIDNIGNKQKEQATGHQVQIKITYQNPDFKTPWRSKNPGSRLATGTYIGNNRILLPASFLINHTLIEVRSLEEPSAKTANLIRLDYESDLALIHIENPGKLFQGIRAMNFTNDIFINQDCILNRLDSKGEIQEISGKIDNLNIGMYPEARIDLPYLEFSTTEKVYGSGELVLSTGNQAIGILNDFSAQSGKGRVVPSRIIYTFLSENQKFSYKGFLYRPITDSTTSKYYGMENENSGVLITDIILNSTADKILQSEDILLKVGDFEVDGKGRIDHPKFGKISFVYLMHSGQEFGYSTGKSIPVEILRNKKRLKLSLTLKPYPESAILIPHGSPRGLSPSYLIVGGLLFIELSEFYLQEFGRNWRSRVDKKMLYKLDYHKYRNSIDQSSRRLVYLMQVLPDEGNNGYHEIQQVQLTHINDKPILDLEDLKEKIDKTKSNHLNFLLEDNNRIIFNKKSVVDIDRRIQKNYQIPILFSPPNTNKD